MYESRSRSARGTAAVLSLALAMHAASEAMADPDEIVLHSTWDDTSCGSGADVWGEGDYAYWAHFGVPCVDIVDIADVANPQWVSSYHVPPPDDFVSAQDIKVHDGLAYVAHEGGAFNAASIVDVRDPTNPVRLTTVRPTIDGHTYSNAHNLFYHQGYLYLCDNSNSVAVVDLTHYDPDEAPANITTGKWQIANVGTAFVHDIVALKNRLYVSAWDQIVIYDITDLEAGPPVLLGEGTGQSSHAAWPTADERWLVTTEERTNGGLKLYEVTEDGDGGVVVTLHDEVVEPPTTFSAHNPIIVGNRVYTAWYASGLVVHEIDRENKLLVELGRLSPGNTWGVYPLQGLDRIIVGGFAYLGFVDASLCAPIADDFDGDGDVDFADFAEFQRCAGLPTFDAACATAFDADCDGDVDLDDYADYSGGVTGPLP